MGVPTGWGDLLVPTNPWLLLDGGIYLLTTHSTVFSTTGVLKKKLLKVEMARKGQTELKKQLWDDLRSIQAAQ